MPYRKFPLFTGGYFHIFNRGTEKRDIFLSRADNERFLNKLGKYIVEEKVSILAFCLMPNHFHLLLKQLIDNSITNFMRKLGTAYSMFFNKKYERVGPLFQGRFKVNLIERDEELLQVSRYIHLNPVGMILNKIKDGSLEKTRPLVFSYLLGYSWSSFRDYIRKKSDVCNLEILSYFSKKNPNLDYKNFILDGIKPFIEGKLVTLKDGS